MTDNEDVIFRIMEDIKQVLQSIAKLSGNIIPVLSYEELMDKTKMAPKPCAGVIYEGMRATPEGGKDTNRLGISAEAVFTILILAEGVALNSPQTKQNNIMLLGKMRKSLVGRKSPTLHKYRFMLETPEDEKAGSVMWAQRWAVPIPVI